MIQLARRPLVQSVKEMPTEFINSDSDGRAMLSQSVGERMGMERGLYDHIVMMTCGWGSDSIITRVIVDNERSQRIQ